MKCRSVGFSLKEREVENCKVSSRRVDIQQEINSAISMSRYELQKMTCHLEASTEREGNWQELATKRAMPDARVPETPAGSGVFPLNTLNCENSFVSRREPDGLTRSTEMINDKRCLRSDLREQSETAGRKKK